MSGPTRVTLLDELRATHTSDRWAEFFEDYGRLLRQWLVSQRVNSNDADDIQQETMLTVLKELPSFEHNGRPGAFRKWLKGILLNRIRRLWEKKTSRKESSNLEQLAETLEDETTRVSIEFNQDHDRFLVNELLNRAKHQFPEDRVTMFRELVLDEIPINTLVEKYQLSTGTIRVQQHRILIWLKDVGGGLVDF